MKYAFLYGEATVKIDGACCAIIDGEFYKRYDCRRGKIPPEGAISCSEPDPVTGHWPFWVKCRRGNPYDQWFWKAYDNTKQVYGVLEDGTYEAIGVHFRANPYGLDKDILERHGERKIEVPREFNALKEYLRTHNEEGVVFYVDGEPICKIKRSDFGFPWNTYPGGSVKSY